MMNLEAKETRMVILGLKSLKKDYQEKMATLSDEEDEYVYLANDLVLLESLIGGFESTYAIKIAE